MTAYGDFIVGELTGGVGGIWSGGANGLEPPETIYSRTVLSFGKLLALPVGDS